MKFCIPSADDRGLDAPVADHFGHAAWFTIVDTDTGRVESRENPGCHSDHGACHHVGILRGLGVEAVAGLRIGRRSTEALRAAGIEVLSAHATRVEDVVTAMRAGRLDLVDLESTCEGHGLRSRHRQREG